MAIRRTALIAGAAATGIAAGICTIVAPRWGDEQLKERWEEISLYRFAHRGLHDNRTPAPENSLAAFRLAREADYGSELDVHLSADGQLVVIHDSDLRRACGTQGFVERLTAEELGRRHLFGTKECIPTLAQVLEVYEKGQGTCPPLIIEAKTCGNNADALTSAIMAELDAHQVPYAIESFDPRVLWWLRRNRNEVLRGQLSENFANDGEAQVGLVAGQAHASLASNVFTRPDFIAFRFVDRNHPSVHLVCGILGGHRVYWTVKNAEELALCDKDGAVAIFEGFEPDADEAE